MTSAVVAEWQRWLQISRGFYAREQKENHTNSNNTSSPSSNANNINNNLSSSWGYIRLHKGIASVVSLLLLLVLYQITAGPAEISREALQDRVLPTFDDCSELDLKGEKRLVVVVEGQHYHTFPSHGHHANPGSTCQSKFQQHCFRKNSGPEHFPPPKFLSLLRDYEAYHENCTKGHDLTALGVKGDTPEGCRYLVWQAMDGMGNQLLSLVCSFVYSLLTNRVMLIATDSHIDRYLCNPFPHSSWLLPEDFPEAQLRGGAKRVHIYLDETLAIVRGHNHSGNTIPLADLPYFISQAPKHLHAFITCCDEKRDHQFFCPSAQKLFSGSNWFFYHSHEYTLPGFYFIPEFREKLNDWFPHHDVFMHASRYLLNPENGIWVRISQFYKAHMDGVDKQIGIQPRSWGGDYNPSISRQILRCAVDQHLLPKTQREQKTRNETNMQEIRGAKVVHVERHADISVLVTSLRGEYRDDLALEYVNHTNEEGLDVGVISASSEGVQRTGDAEHDRKAVIDIWLLSFMHDLVITPSSTFGSTASGMAGIVPLLFNNYGQDKVLEAACARTNAGGPCFLVYPSNQPCDLDPPQASILNPDQMVPEVRYCYFNRGLGIITT